MIKNATFAQMNAIFKKILNQETFKYQWHKIVEYYCRCLCLKNDKQVKKSSMEDFYLKKGTKKLAHDLDIVSIVRMVHNVDIMVSVLFT